MSYFTGALNIDEVRMIYKLLVKKYHPDAGGNNEIMKTINYEYARQLKMYDYHPKKLSDVKVGCRVFVNNTPCVVTEVQERVFKAKSLKTHREAYFSKENGYAMLNYKFKAQVNAY